MVAVIYSFFFLFTEFPCQSLCPLAFQHKIKETDRKRAREHRWTFRICWLSSFNPLIVAAISCCFRSGKMTELSLSLAVFLQHESLLLTFCNSRYGSAVISTLVMCLNLSWCGDFFAKKKIDAKKFYRKRPPHDNEYKAQRTN